MFKKLFTVIVAASLALGMAGGAFAAFEDLRLIRVYYDRAGAEIATDLGSVASLAPSTGATSTTTIAGSFGSLTSGFAVYFALDRDNFDLWASNGATPPMVIGTNTGLTAIKNGTNSTYPLYNTQGGANYTGLASATSSYKNKLSSTQGWLANTITGVSARAATELSITTLSTKNTQILYYWDNATALTADIIGRTGVAVATITTNADGSTTISPPPPPSTVPDAPTIGTATATGDGVAEVTFTPVSDGGSPITLYTATSSPGGITSTGSASPIIINGLLNGTSYTFTVTAKNAIGTSAASTASNSVATSRAPTAPAVPGAPAIDAATAGDAQATVAFTAPGSDGGSAITYTVTSSPDGITASGAASPIIVTGLTNGTPYTFTVTATNATGTSVASAASDSVTPSPAPTVPTVPGVPAIGAVTAGNAQSTVEFTAPASDGGSAITGYTVTSSPDGITASGAASPITVPGLTNGTTYTFTVTATNAIGTSAASAASGSVTPSPAPVSATPPDAPAIGSVTAGNAQATVEFTAPASDGGSVITGYTVTSTPGGLTNSGIASPITVTGLTNGTSYTFTVTATNAIGTSPLSTSSVPVIPKAPPITFTVTSIIDVNANGKIVPAIDQQINAGMKTSFILTPDTGYQIATVAGCGGTLNGFTYTTAGIIGNCEVRATFIDVPAVKGDLNGDGKTDVADALLAFQIAIGLQKPTDKQQAAGDVAPLVDGKSAPDLKIDIADVVAILQKSVEKLNNW